MKLINFQLLTPTDIVLIVSLLLVFFIQLYYIFRYYLKLALHKNDPFNLESKRVGIILPLRNEETNIRELIDKFTGLSDIDYEVLVVNEFSEDNTLQILNILAENNQKLKVTGLSQETRFLDKQAINIGMKGINANWVVLLNAYSGTIPEEWLNRMSGLLDDQSDAVIGYSSVEKRPGYRNFICRLERFQQFMVSGSRVLAGKPFVFHENNVLFRKSLYFDTQGFKHKLNLNFANLELIFNECFTKQKLKISTDPELVIREAIDDDRGDHIRLLKKSVQIRQGLSFFSKLGLFIDDFSRIALLALCIALVILHPEYWIWFSTILLIYFVLVLIVIEKLLNRLQERMIFVTSFLYFLIKPIIHWWVFCSVYIIHHRNRWN